MAQYVNEITVEEIQIKIPYGHIAAKWWGPKHVRPILAIHGYQDNAGTFDRLIPLLPKEQSYLAIDLPGHGHSSYIPNGTVYNIFDYAYIIYYICKMFGWAHVSIMAHSLGALISFILITTFPNYIDLYIAIDAHSPLNLSFPGLSYFFEAANDQMIKADLNIMQQNEAPGFTFDEMIQKLSNAMYFTIPTEPSNPLFVRGLKRHPSIPNKFNFRHDPRLRKLSIDPFGHKVSVEMCKNVTCPFMFIDCDDSHIVGSINRYLNKLEAYHKNEKFEYNMVKGDHYVHLTHPERISELISKFIRKYRNDSVQSKL